MGVCSHIVSFGLLPTAEFFRECIQEILGNQVSHASLSARRVSVSLSVCQVLTNEKAANLKTEP